MEGDLELIAGLQSTLAYDFLPKTIFGSAIN